MSPPFASRPAPGGRRRRRILAALLLALALGGLPEAAEAQQAPLIPIEVVNRPGFSRIVFDWPIDAVLRVTQEGSRAVLNFDRPGRLDLVSLRERLPAPVTGVEPAGDGPGLAIALDLMPGYRLRHFRNGNAVMVDVVEAPEARSAAAPAQDGTPLAQVATATEQPAAEGPAAPVPAAEAEGTGPEATAAATTGGEQPATGIVPPGEQPPATAEGPQAPAVTQAAPLPAADAGPAAAQDVQQVLTVAAEPNGNGITLTFPFETIAGAAAFRRADRLWLVFDEPVRLDLSALQALRPDLLRNAGQDLAAQGTVLLLNQAGELAMTPTLSRHGLDWVVDLQPGIRRDPANPLEVIVEPEDEEDDHRVFLPTGEAEPALRRGLRLRDPVVGDSLLVMPLRFAGFGVKGGRQFAQFSLLPSLQGVVVKPWADGVELQGVPNGVEVDVATGLLLAAAEPAAQPGRAPKEGLLQFDPWRHAAEGGFHEMHHRLLYDVSVAPDRQRLQRQRDLIRFMFAHGYAADVLGLLQVLDDMQGGLGELDPELRAIRGIARLQMRRLDEAASDLESPHLADYPEIALWRTRLAAERGDWERAIAQFREGLQALDSYPPDVRAGIRLAAARAMLEAGAPRDALREIGVLLEEDEPTRTERAWAALVEARAHAALDDAKAAGDAFEQAIDSGVMETRIKGLYARALADFDNGDIERHQLIEQLDRLRYAWRGDDFEYELLRRLGELYLAEQNYREGLITLRQTAVYFPERAADSTGVAEEMARAFRRLFLQGEADRLEPLTALALYYDFRELTPSGDEGDEMIRKLADRLVAVDLLNQAAELMQHQVNFRLDGVDRARVGARLAVIQLLNRQPDQALRALAESEMNGLPAELQVERQQLRARALADLGRYAEGLQALSGLEDPRSQRLRADINWRAKNWHATAATLEPLAEEYAQSEGPLSPEARREILQLAISLSLDGAEDKIAALRQRFLARLEGMPEGRAFDLVTDNLQRETGNIRELTAAIAEVDQLEAFMADYREKLSRGGLDAIN